MDEEKTPQQWYVILRAESSLLEECRTANAPWSIKAYVWAFAATPGPFSIEPLMTKDRNLQNSRRLLLPVSRIMCRYCAMHRNGCK
jgi:hypothetical protein